MTTSKPRVLRLGQVAFAHQRWEELSKVAEIVECTSSLRAEFIEDLQSKYRDVVGITRTFHSISQTGRFDSELVSHLPPSVKAVCHCGAGYDQIDVEPLNARGIQLSNVTVPVEAPTADTAIYLVLTALRNYQIGHDFLVAGKWGVDKGPHAPLGRDPEGKVVGILGMGGIGRAIRDRLQPFGFGKITYHNRTRLSPELEKDSEYVGYDDLIANSDVIFISVPLNAHTRHSVNKELFAKMKTGVVIVNTARGAVIKELDLIESLKEGKIGSFASDVFEHEPSVPKELYSLPNVVSLPHMGTFTHEAVQHMEEWVVDNIETFITEGKVKTIVPEQYNLF